MSLFTSKREKHLWLYTATILLAIYSTLGLSRQLAGKLRDKGWLDEAFWISLFLIAAVVLIHGLKKQTGRLEILIWLGIFAVYLLLFLRMAIVEERSHLIEYSVLAIFIYEALLERKKHGGDVKRPAVLAFFITVFLGIFDETIQLFIPSRVFDPIDMLFNSLAALMAIGSSSILSWARRRIENY